MDDKLTSLNQLRQVAMETKGLIGQVACKAAAAIEELEKKKQDSETALERPDGRFGSISAAKV